VDPIEPWLVKVPLIALIMETRRKNPPLDTRIAPGTHVHQGTPEPFAERIRKFD
jgi:hypothetical protein